MSVRVRGGRRSLGLPLTTVVFMAALVAAVGTALAQRTSLPHSLVGCWTRTVPAGVPGVHAGPYTISTTQGGLLVVYLQGTPGCNGRTDFSLTVSAAGGKLVMGSAPILPGSCKGQGTYGWKVTGKTLTLRLIKDKCRVRGNFFPGAWKKIPAG